MIRAIIEGIIALAASLTAFYLLGSVNYGVVAIVIFVLCAIVLVSRQPDLWSGIYSALFAAFWPALPLVIIIGDLRRRVVATNTADRPPPPEDSAAS